MHGNFGFSFHRRRVDDLARSPFKLGWLVMLVVVFSDAVIVPLPSKLLLIKFFVCEVLLLEANVVNRLDCFRSV